MIFLKKGNEIRTRSFHGYWKMTLAPSKRNSFLRGIAKRFITPSNIWRKENLCFLKIIMIFIVALFEIADYKNWGETENCFYQKLLFKEESSRIVRLIEIIVLDDEVYQMNLTIFIWNIFFFSSSILRS